MNEQQITPIIPEPGKVPHGELVRNFTSRAELDAAMTRLNSAGLPAQSFFVVGHQLKQVEYFMGKLSYPRVALSSALSGAMFGALIGVVTALVTGTSVLPHLASAVPLGIAVWMIFGILSFARANKNGAYQMRQQLVPSAFSLMANPGVAASARQALNVPNQPHVHQSPAPFVAPQAPVSARPDAPQAPVESPQDPASFVGPEYNKDGSRAGGKFGLRIDDPEEYAKLVRKEPAPVEDTEERVEKVRQEQSSERYGLRVDNPEEIEQTVRSAPAPAPKKASKSESQNEPEPESQSENQQEGSHRV